MTYLDYLNGFHRYLETGRLGFRAQLLYLKLLHVFNRAGWPAAVRVDNLRLMTMCGNSSEPTAIRARKELIRSGFLTYEPGRKGLPGRYGLSVVRAFPGPDTDSIRENNGQTVRESVNLSVSHNKTKTKTKTKTNPPHTPRRGVDRGDMDLVFDLARGDPASEPGEPFAGTRGEGAFHDG